MARERMISVDGQWQPYPNHPQVRELTDRLDHLQEKIEREFMTDLSVPELLLAERQAAEARLEQVTSALLRDDTLVPHWVAHRGVELAGGATPCLDCGNNIPQGESTCSYCGWTYLGEGQAGD
jgi:hypothetical protein